MTDTLLRSPLHDWHARHGARFVPFSGWEMPVQYTSILEEHRAVRTAAGLFDVSHMGEATVTGPEAAKFLDYIATNNVGNLAPGRARYTFMCDPDGGVVDDIIIYRTGPEAFFICLNAGNTPGDVAWLREHSARFNCKLTDVSSHYAQLALQGPKALEVAAKLAAPGVNFADVPRFGFIDTTAAGIPVRAARTGYTGEDGLEFYVAPDQAAALADAILAAGADIGVKPCGLGARDSLRLEAGLPLYGHEISHDITPVQACLAWAVKLDKPGGFIGRERLAAEVAAKPARKVVHFLLDDRRLARAGMPVLAGGKNVGSILSGTLSPLLNKPIGSALVDRAALESGAEVAVDVRGALIPLRIAKPPLHKTS